MPQQNTEDLKRQIEYTRAKVAADVDAISAKMSPEHIKEQAKASIQRVKEDMKERVKYETRRAGHNLASSARDNSVPLLLVGAGVGWLVYNSRSRSRSGWSATDYYRADLGYGDEPVGSDIGPAHRARERVAEAGQHARERVAEIGEHARDRFQGMRQRAGQMREHAGERLHHAREGAQTFVHDNPIAAAAVALAVGAGVGLLLPSTERENRMLGARRDKLLERGREAMGEFRDVAEHTAKEAARIAKEDLESRNIMQGNTVPGGTEAPGGPGGGFDSTLGSTDPSNPKRF